MSNLFSSSLYFYKDEGWNSIWSSFDRMGTFLGKFVTNQHDTGSALPSSPWLCQQMVSEFVPGTEKKGRRFLELGAGTGAVTEAILPLLGPKDHLDVIECDADFSRAVQTLVDNSGKAHQVKVHTIYAENFTSANKYDHIFSSLPLTNFSHELVEKIYAKIHQLLKKSGKLSYFEYIWVASIRLSAYYFSDSKSYTNLSLVLKTKDKFCKVRESKVQEVWANILPAYVVHVKNS